MYIFIQCWRNKSVEFCNNHLHELGHFTTCSGTKYRIFWWEFIYSLTLNIYDYLALFIHPSIHLYVYISTHLTYLLNTYPIVTYKVKLICRHCKETIFSTISLRHASSIASLFRKQGIWLNISYSEETE